MKYILMDVEGTTTSISFVHDVLFPYSKKYLKQFLVSHQSLEEIQKIIKDTKETVKAEEHRELQIDEVIEQLLLWIETDRKHPALKSLQGFIWKEGYESGELKGHIYPEVKECFQAWKKAELQLGIYSSGSVEAQKLLFRYSIEGDLTHFLSHHFDTHIGHKREVNSYSRIAEELQFEARDILFLSDIKEELDAAKLAGFKTIQLIRTPPLENQGHPQVLNFLGINI